jgi:hypothetical protein
VCDIFCGLSNYQLIIVNDTHRLISILFAHSGVFSSIFTIQCPSTDLVMDSALTGKVTLLEVVITSLVENLSPQAQSLLRATVPSLFRLLMTSVGDSHFGQVIFLWSSSAIVLLHAALLEEVFAGFVYLFRVEWILPPYPCVILVNITFCNFSVDLHFIDLLPLQRHFLRERLFGLLGSDFQSPLILAERAQ